MKTGKVFIATHEKTELGPNGENIVTVKLTPHEKLMEIAKGIKALNIPSSKKRS
jgi:hypothetical protein